MTPADTCRRKRWKVGTRLIGTENAGTEYSETSVIEITAIGRQNVLAVELQSNRHECFGHEGSWTFDCRDWKEVKT